MPALRSFRVAVFLGSRAIIRGNRGIIVLTVALMAVIFAELLFVPSLIQGATNEIQLELRDYVTAGITVTPSGSAQTISDPSALLAAARETSGVVAATATVLAGSEIGYHNLTDSWPVLAIDPSSYAHVFKTPRTIIEGSFLDPGANDEIVLGIGIAGAGRTQVSTYRSSLQEVQVGDYVTVTMQGGLVHPFKVKGIYETDLSQANTVAFITAATAATLVRALAGASSTMYLKTRQVGDEQAVIDRLRIAHHDVHFQSWETLSASVKDITGSFNIIKSILNAVSLAVAAITVFIVTYVDLINRRRTMGIERAIGISGPSITLSYGLKTIVFAAVSVVLGGGLYFGVAIPLVNRFPFRFPIGPVTLSVTAGELRRDAAILVIVALLGAVVPTGAAVRTQLRKTIWG